MKKLIYTSILILSSFVGQGFADTLTIGKPVLVEITTNTQNRSVSWGDILNHNFRFISSTLGTAVDALNTSSSSFDNRLDGWDLYKTTAEPIIDDLVQAISTGIPALSGLLSHRTTAETAIEGTRAFLSTYTNNASNLTNTVGVFVSSGFMARVATITITGSGVDSVVSYSSGLNILINDDSGGSVGNPFSTATIRMSMSGVIGVASTTFVGLPGWWFSTGPDTFTITEIYASVANPSNIADTSFRVAWSTGGSFPAYSYVSPELDVPLSASIGVGISTTFAGVPNTLFSVHCTSIAATGAPASDATFIFKGWGWNRP